MDTNCLNDERIQALADGEGDPVDRAHVDSCPACAVRLEQRTALMASIAGALNPPLPLPEGFRLTADAPSERNRMDGATRMRRLQPQSSRRWIYSAAAIAATLVAVLFVVPAVRRTDATVSASEILARSASQLSAVTHGVEVLEYELVLGGVPREMVPDQVDGTYRIWQAIDHDVPGRFRFASYTQDGRMFSSIAEDPRLRRRVAAFTVEGQPYRFETTLPPTAANLSLPDLQRLHMEASIAMMQASGNQLIETVEGSSGRLYRIQVPRVAGPGTSPVWDLTDARVLIDARDYSVVEFAVQGSFLKSPYSLSYKQLSHVAGATLPPDAFTVPSRPGEIVVSGEGTAVPTHDVMVLALRALAEAKRTR